MKTIPVPRTVQGSSQPCPHRTSPREIYKFLTLQPHAATINPTQKYSERSSDDLLCSRVGEALLLSLVTPAEGPAAAANPHGKLVSRAQSVPVLELLKSESAFQQNPYASHKPIIKA